MPQVGIFFNYISTHCSDLISEVIKRYSETWPLYPTGPRALQNEYGETFRVLRFRQSVSCKFGALSMAVNAFHLPTSCQLPYSRPPEDVFGC